MNNSQKMHNNVKKKNNEKAYNKLRVSAWGTGEGVTSNAVGFTGTLVYI